MQKAARQITQRLNVLNSCRGRAIESQADPEESWMAPPTDELIEDEIQRSAVVQHS